MKKILSLFSIIFLLTSCEKKDLNWNLPRSNPLDIQEDSTNTNNTTVGPLNFTQYFVLNGDTIKAGAWLYIKVYVKNNGSSTAKGVRYEVTTTSPYSDIFIGNGDNYFGDITAGQEVMLKPSNSGDNFSIYVKIDTATPVGSQINYSITMHDDKNKQWVESFHITTQ